MNSITYFGDQVKNILFYPFTLLSQTYSLIASAGTIKMALLTLKNGVFTRMSAIVYTPPSLQKLLSRIENIQALHAHDEVVQEATPPPAPPWSLVSFPREMADKITEGLDPCTVWAFVSCCPEIRNLYAPEERARLALRKKCVELISLHNLSRTEQVTLRRCWRDIWLHLLDPQLNNKDLMQSAAIAEQFGKHLNGLEQKNILVSNVLPQLASRNLQAQWERLAEINIYLCIALSDLSAALDQPVPITDNIFLLTNLFTNFSLVMDFINCMDEGPSWGEQYNVLNYTANKRLITLVAGLLNDSPGLIDVRGLNNTTALMRAAFRGDVETVQLLWAHEAHIDLQDTYGNTALMHACMEGKIRVAEILLSHGANTELQNRSDDNALSLAQTRGHDDVVQLLESHQQEQGQSV